MTDRQLQVLHQRGEAKLGQIYVSDTGKRYVGIERGRLRLVQSTDVSSIQAQIDALQAQIDALSFVEAVTDDGNTVVSVDNTDPVNPIIGFNGVQVDGVTVTGDGTVGNPLVSVGTGTVTNIATANGVTGGPITTTGTIQGINAQADGSTKGVSAFTAADFNDDGSGLISIDYTNGQAATGAQKGFLTSADWTTFNGKVSTTRAINTTAPLSGGGDLSADRTLTTSMATNKLIGRGSGGTGVMEEITLGSGLELSSTTLKPDFVVLGKSGATVSSTNTLSEEVLASVLIPSGTLGNNDEIRAWALFDATGGAAGNRIFRIRLHTSAAAGGTVYQQATLGTGGGGYAALAKVIMKNASNAQEGFGQIASVFGTGSNFITSALSTGSDMYIVFTSLKVTSGADGATLRAYSVEQIRA